MHAEPSFLQGVFPFRGSGLDRSSPLGDGGLTFTVPEGRYAQPTYFRAGNSADALVSLGVNQSLISADWRGETQPAVSTGDGVREPLNRRATITVNPGAMATGM